MTTPDVNVLVAAFREDHPHHRQARGWMEPALAQAATGAPFTLMPMVLASFLRLVTSPRIFREPAPVNRALAFVDAVLGVPGVRLLEIGGEWPSLRRLCEDRNLSGNDLPDAWLAAATIHAGEHLVSFDRDFRRLLPRSRLTLLDPGARTSA